MRKMSIVFVSLFCVWLGACGSAAPELETAPAALPENPEPVAQPAPAPKPEPPPAPPQVTQHMSTGSQSKCDLFEEEDGTQMVTAQDYDWFLYVSTEANVECGTFGGNVTITDGNLKQVIKPLVPQGGSGKKAEQMLREQAAGFIRTGLQDEYGDGRDLVFEKVKLGKLKRPALCADAEIDMKGFLGRVVACVTSKTNVNDEVVVHRSIWVGASTAYDATATPKLVKEASANWFRYSDTDGFGKILVKW